MNLQFEHLFKDRLRIADDRKITADILSDFRRIHIDLDQLEQVDVNFKSKLLEWSQKEKHHLDFKVIKSQNQGHDRLYHVMVVIDEKEYGVGADYSIKGADQLAAEKTWQMLVEQNIIKEERHGD